MLELEKQLVICLSLIEQTRQIINTPYLEAITYDGERVLTPNPNLPPSRALIEAIQKILPLLLDYDKNFYTRVKSCSQTLVDNSGKINAFQFGGILQLLTLLNDNLSNLDTNNIKNSKPLKLFISHSEKDKVIVGEFVELLTKIGFTPEILFCSSYTGFNIPVGSGDIYDYLKNEFDTNNLFVIFMLSKNYYSSPACLNEMGASWIKSCKNQSVLLPDFKFRNIKGAINPRDIGFVIDNQYRLTEFKELLEITFSLNKIPSALWQKYQNDFLDNINAF